MLVPGDSVRARDIEMGWANCFVRHVTRTLLGFSMSRMVRIVKGGFRLAIIVGRCLASV